MFDNIKYYIGEKFTYRNPEDDAIWRKSPTIFTIDDILFSLKDNKIKIEYSWYNDSIDSGYGTADIDEFEKDYKILVS